MKHRPLPESVGGTESAFAEPIQQIGAYLRVIRRRWLLVAAVLALTLTVFGIRYAITPPLFRAKAQIQIERRSVAALANSNAVNPWLENVWNVEFYPTQYRLLQSRGLAAEVVRRLRLAEDLQFNPGGVAALGGAPATGIEPSGEERAVIGRLAGQVLGGLEVIPIQRTQLVEIAYTSRHPELTAKIANGVAETFIDWRIARQSETIGQTSSLLNDQIVQLRREITANEVKLEELSRSQELFVDNTASNRRQRLDSLEESYAEATKARIAAASRLAEVRSTPPDLLAGAAVDRERTRLAELQQEFTSRSATFQPGHPEMVALQKQIDEAQRSLNQAITQEANNRIETARGEYQAALREEQSLAVEVSAVRSAKLGETSATIEYSNLQRELEAQRKSLDGLQQRQREASVVAGLQEGRASNVRVVDYALIPGAPFRPSLQREMSLGLVLGLMGGIGLVFLLEFLDRTVKTPEQAEKLLGLPVLAAIPDGSMAGRSYGYGYGYGYGQSPPAEAGKRSRWKSRPAAEEEIRIELLPHVRPHQPISEAYRALRTALLLSSAEEIKIVAVSSAETGEGKSTTSVNLAVVMAQLGRRVLLVDADLRKSRLHRIFGLSNRFGLVNLLTGATREEGEKVFQPTEVPNLYLLSAGPTPPNPAELLASDRMRDFLGQVRSKFDFVVVDTTPTLAVTDATLVGSMVDGLLHCLRANKVTREDARATRDRLLMADVKILGTVLNCYRPDQSGAAKRYYRYTESYGDPPAAAEDSAA